MPERADKPTFVTFVIQVCVASVYESLDDRGWLWGAGLGEGRGCGDDRRLARGLLTRTYGSLGHSPGQPGAGLGHGTSLVLVGLPLVLLGRHLPGPVQQAAEALIGVIIILLAARLLVRWRRGHFHAHTHGHNGVPAHRHVRSHESDSSHEHAHNVALRTPLSSYGIGLVHGIGGSGGLTLLLLSTIPDPAQATGALVIFAGGTAVSMALLSTAFGLAMARGPIARNFERFTPALGALSLVFGTWYMLGALGLVVYPL